MNLQAKISDAGGIYKRYSTRLEKLGIIKFEDFLYHFPFRYDDFSIISDIKDLQEGEVVTIKGKVIQIKNLFTRSYKKIQKAIVEDATGQIEITWFNQPYLTKMISVGDLISLSGKVEQNLNSIGMVSPEFEILNDDTKGIHTGRLVPVYPETYGISSKWLRKQTNLLLTNNISEIEDFIPIETMKRHGLEELTQALKQIHFPDSEEYIYKAKKRLSFEELLIIQSAAKLRKKEWDEITTGKQMKKFENKVNEFINSLPFELTNAQKRAVEEITNDLSSKTPMNRLLEGDVGSGKTVVAAIASYMGFLNKYQTAFIAPTEILANQHFNTINSLLTKFGLKTKLITSSNKLEPGDFDVLVGTHAMINDKVKFSSLALIIIDEQQRFGVEQRGSLRKKGDNPHLLTMTATPIPRTVALTLYGDLSLTLIDEMPKKRKIVKTWLVPEIKRRSAYEWIEKEIIKNKSQAFIICPFIEESESMVSVKAAKKEFESLQKTYFKNRKLALLHGKMKSTEKKQTLEEFKNGEIDILVATPIVEVGIDIPNATIIVIEASDKFGLAQLHQLRGRVGRGEKQSYCLLFTDSTNLKTIQRLKAMENIHLGAKLAEIDLELRGSGEIYGTRQHGTSLLKIAQLSDYEIIKKTKTEAQILVSEIQKYPRFLQKIKMMNAAEVNPD